MPSHSGTILTAASNFGSLVNGLLHKSIVLALVFDLSLHQVSHQSHSWGKDLMPTWWIMLFGKSWSRLAKELGSAERPWYWPRSLSPAANCLNLL